MNDKQRKEIKKVLRTCGRVIHKDTSDYTLAVMAYEEGLIK